MSGILTTRLSYYSSASHPEEKRVVSLEQVIAEIQDDTHKARTNELRALLREDEERYEREKKTLPGVTFAGTFGHRSIAGFSRSSGLMVQELDLKPKVTDLERCEALKHELATDPFIVLLFTSPSGAGLRLIFRIPVVDGDAAYKELWAQNSDYVEQTYDVATDKACKDVSRLLFLSHDPSPIVNPEAVSFPGYHGARELLRARAELENMVDGERYFTRNKLGFTLGGHIAGGRLEESHVVRVLGAVIERTTKHPDKSVKAFWKAVEEGKAKPIQPEGEGAQLEIGAPPDAAMPPEPDESEWPPEPEAEQSEAPARRKKAGTLPYSDYTNALAMVRAHGKDMRYCYPWKSYLIWTGSHWERDITGESMRRAKQVIKSMAARAETIDDDVLYKATLKHVKESFSAGKLKAMVELARSEPGIPVRPDELDANPWLLNVRNGTLDLRTSKLRPHRRQDLLTKYIDIRYDQSATCPQWKEFLWRIMGGTIARYSEMSASEKERAAKADKRARELIAFLRRAIGYSLTGSGKEQCLFILHGPTKTGKSTFLATLRSLLGAYATQAEMTTFMHKDRDQVRNDLADLAGARVVCAVESQQDRRLAEALIKQLTGGTDLIKARFLFEEYFSFRPQFKVYIASNHRPVIKDTDHAIWERIRLVPFVVQIPKNERDKTLDEKLQAELPGILAWAVKGCLEWQEKDGLKEPEAVLLATQEYQEESDSIGKFLMEICCLGDVIPGKPYKVKSSRLLKAYQQWSGEGSETQKSFAAHLQGKGYESKREKTGVFWHGIGLQSDTTN